MDEKIKKEENDVKSEDKPINTDVRVSPVEEESPLSQARKLNEENKKIVEQLKEERMKMEKAAAEMQISGRSFAGQKPVEKTEDEKWAESAKERYAGTGMDPTPNAP